MPSFGDLELADGADPIARRIRARACDRSRGDEHLAVVSAAVEVASFDKIAAEFRRRIEQTTWCTLTTVDARGRPRGRIVHPVWEEPIGWLATFRTSFKAKHVDANPWVSLAYWDQSHEQVYADCRATWIDDDAQKARLWELYSTKPEGYSLDSFWKGVDDPNYGLLRLDPWRVELWSVKGLFERTPPQVWRSGD